MYMNYMKLYHLQVLRILKFFPTAYEVHACFNEVSQLL